MSKNRLLKLLPFLLAFALLLSVCAVTALADPDASDASSAETSVESSADPSDSSDTTSDSPESGDESDTSSTSSDASGTESTASSSSEAASSTAVSDTTSSKEEPATRSKIPWKLIITLAVIVVIVAVLFLLAKTNSKMGQRIAKFFKDYKSELRKISWMTRKDLIRSTIVVLVVLVVSGIAIGLLDFFFSWLVKLLSSIG